ncbi:MAG: DUF7594 domain-containing protein [Egibacteraceae bacterium]
MFDTISKDFHIFSLDTSTQKWTDTGTVLDDRPDSRADVLWDGSKLLVASHVFSESPTSGTPSRLYRYSYNSVNKKYTLDAGFPTRINNVKAETLVIDKNSGSNARLWATWVQSNTVYVNSANADGTGWGTPFKLPVSDATVAKDDISSLVSYGGNKIVIVWSNQTNSNVYYSVHVDGEPNGTWAQTRVASGGAPGIADDHISLRSLQEANGKVYAAVKTSLSNSNDPLTLLLEYDPAMNKWKSHTFGLNKDAHTRPIVMFDKGTSQAGDEKVHMFATAPESGGSIYMKNAPLSNISFPAGKGTAVMTDGTGGTEDDINNVTSTKQPVDSSTGLVVLATNDTTDRYWHAYLPPSGEGGGSTAPTASFTANPTTGQAPLTVQFTDTSTGSPTSWLWEFGDGATSTTQSLSHAYASAGTFTVTLTATNANGNDTVNRTITVTSGGGGGGGGTLTFTPTADAKVNSASPAKNYGTTTDLRLRAGGPEYLSYFKFAVTGLSGPATVKLRLFVTDPSPDSGSAFNVEDKPWTETGITYTSRPLPVRSALGRTSANTASTTVEIPLGTITGNGTYSWALQTSSTNSVFYSSREGANPPQLVVTPG